MLPGGEVRKVKIDPAICNCLLRLIQSQNKSNQVAKENSKQGGCIENTMQAITVIRPCRKPQLKCVAASWAIRFVTAFYGRSRKETSGWILASFSSLVTYQVKYCNTIVESVADSGLGKCMPSIDGISSPRCTSTESTCLSRRNLSLNGWSHSNVKYGLIGNSFPLLFLSLFRCLTIPPSFLSTTLVFSCRLFSVLCIYPSLLRPFAFWLRLLHEHLKPSPALAWSCTEQMNIRWDCQIDQLIALNLQTCQARTLLMCSFRHLKASRVPVEPTTSGIVGLGGSLTFLGEDTITCDRSALLVSSRSRCNLALKGTCALNQYTQFKAVSSTTDK